MSKWTKTPPTVAGWYWMRTKADEIPQIVAVKVTSHPCYPDLVYGIPLHGCEPDGEWDIDVPPGEECNDEWWSEPIQRPPT